MVFGVGADSSNDDSGPPIPKIDNEGNVVTEGPNWPGSGAPPTGFPASPDVQWNTNDSAVPWDFALQSAGSADRPRGQMMANDVSVRPFYQAATYPNYLRALARDPRQSPEQRARYDTFLSQLRAYTNSELGTTSTVDSAWRTVLQDAQEGDVPVLQLLSYGAMAMQDMGGGGGGSGAYTGPRESFTIQAESDINATANALALEMIGRTLNEKELARVTKRIRSAEMEQPQVTTGGMARTVTEQGLTAEGREDILREVIAERPEFEKYQLDTTVMDAMNSYIQEKRQVIDV